MVLVFNAFAINLACLTVGASKSFSIRDILDMSIPVFKDSNDCVILALNLACFIVMFRIIPS